MPILTVGNLKKRPLRHSALALVALGPGAQDSPQLKVRPATPKVPLFQGPSSESRGNVPNALRVRFPSFPNSILHLNPIGVKSVNDIGQYAVVTHQDLCSQDGNKQWHRYNHVM